MASIIIMKKYEGSRASEIRYPNKTKTKKIITIRKIDFNLFFWIWSWKDKRWVIEERRR